MRVQSLLNTIKGRAVSEKHLFAVNLDNFLALNLPFELGTLAPPRFFGHVLETGDAPLRFLLATARGRER
jgi:hypothetical protein